MQPLVVTIAAFCDHMNQSGFAVQYSVSPSGSTDFEVTGSAQVGDWTYPGWRYAQLELHAKQDNEVEQNEPVTITLLPDPNGTYAIGVPGVPPEYAPPDAGIKTIQIIDSPPQVSIYPESDGSEDGTPMLFRVSRTGGDTSIPVNVTLALASGSTASAAEIQLSTVSVGSEVYVQIPVVDDSEAEWTERAVLQVMPGPNNVPGTTHIATARIRDNDAAIASLPTMMVANNDDDNSDGTADMSEATASTSDDEIEQIALTIPTTHNENGLVRLTLNGPLAAYDASGARLAAQDGVITWILAAGQTPPQQVLIAATGGVTQVDGASVQLMVTDDGGPQSATTRTTPIRVDVVSVGTTGQVIVGQRVGCLTNVTAPAQWKEEASYQWTVPGERIADYLVTDTVGHVVRLSDAMLREDGVSFHWVDGSFTGIDREVSAAATVAGQTVSRSVKFSVVRPKYEVVTGTAASWRIIQPQPGSNVATLEYSEADDEPGISFTNDPSKFDLPAESTGSTIWVQTGTHWGRYRKTADGAWYHAEETGLDTQFPYSAAPKAEDSPNTPLDPQFYTDVQMRLDAVMWLMFKPSTEGATYVPLASIEWWCDARAQWDGQSWLGPLDSDVRANPPVEDIMSVDAYPEWSRVMGSGGVPEIKE